MLSQETITLYTEKTTSNIEELKEKAEIVAREVQPNYWIVLLLPVVIVSVVFFKKRAR